MPVDKKIYDVVILTTAITRPSLHKKIFGLYKDFVGKDLSIKWFINIDKINDTKINHTANNIKNIFNDHKNIDFVFTQQDNTPCFYNAVKRLMFSSRETIVSCCRKGVVYLEDDWLWNGTLTLNEIHKKHVNPSITLLTPLGDNQLLSFKPAYWSRMIFFNSIIKPFVTAKRNFKSDPEKRCITWNHGKGRRKNIKKNRGIHIFTDGGKEWAVKNNLEKWNWESKTRKSLTYLNATTNKYSLDIRTNIVCSNVCIHCPLKLTINQYKHETKKMTLENFKTYMKSVHTEVEIVFPICPEPFDNKEVIDMMLHAKERDCNVSCSTSLQTVTLEELERIKDVTFNEFNIHLPMTSVSEEFKERLRFIEENFGEYNFISLNEEITEGLEEFNIQENLIPEAIVNEMPMDKKAYYPINRMKGGRLRCEINQSLTSGVLLPNGNVQLCNYDYGLVHTLGNLGQNAYDEIYESKEYVEIKKNFDSRSGKWILCRTCPLAKKHQIKTL